MDNKHSFERNGVRYSKLSDRGRQVLYWERQDKRTEWSVAAATALSTVLLTTQAIV